MESSTWKVFCKAIVNKTGNAVLAAETPQSEPEFICNSCGMTWRCITNLDGKKHSAIKVKCGGTWVKR